MDGCICSHIKDYMTLWNETTGVCCSDTINLHSCWCWQALALHIISVQDSGMPHISNTTICSIGKSRRLCYYMWADVNTVISGCIKFHRPVQHLTDHSWPWRLTTAADHCYSSLSGLHVEWQLNALNTDAMSYAQSLLQCCVHFHINMHRPWWRL